MVTSVLHPLDSRANVSAAVERIQAGLELTELHQLLEYLTVLIETTRLRRGAYTQFGA